MHPRDSPGARTRSSSFSQSRLRAKRGEPPARGRSSAEKRSDRRSDREDRREREQRDIERSRYTSKKELTSQEEEIKRKKEHAAELKAKFLRLKQEVADGQRQLEESREKKRLERKRLEDEQKEEEKNTLFEAVERVAKEATERVAAALVGAPPPPLNAPRSDIPTPPEPVKMEMDAPYIEQLGLINWGVVPEREREQLRLACVLIMSLQERVAEIEGDKTLLMNMMAQDRARALRGQASSSGAASSSSAPPLQSLGRFPPPPPPSGPSGPHQ